MTNQPEPTTGGAAQRDSSLLALMPHIIALLTYAALACIATWPLLYHLDSHLVARPGETGHDVWQHTWNLWWVREALLMRHTNPYQTPMLFYPQGASLYLHSLNLPLALPGLLLLPLCGIVMTYNLLVLLVLVLAGYGSFLLARYISGNAPAALVAGAIVLLSPQRLLELRAAQLAAISDYAIPLTLLVALLALERRTWRAALLVATAMLLAGLSKWYNVFYTLLVLAVLFAWRALIAWRAARLPGLRHEAVPWLRMAVLTLALTAPFVLPAIVEAGMLPYEEPVVLGADVLLLLPTSFAGVLRPVPFDWWQPASFALLPLLLALVGLLVAPRQSALWAVMALVCLVLSLGPTLNVGMTDTGIPLPYALLQALPVLDSFRVPYRLNAVTTLLLAVVAAIGLARGLRRLPPVASWSTALLLALLLLAEVARLPFPLVNASVSPFYSRIAAEPGEWSLLELPLDRMDRHFLEMYTQTYHGKYILTGKTSRNMPRLPYEAAPPIAQVSLGDRRPDIVGLTPTERDQLLRSLRVRYLVVHADSGRAARQAATARELFGPLTQVYSGTELRAYRLDEMAAWLDGPGRTTRVEVPLFLGLDRRWPPREADSTRWLPPDGAGLWVYTPQPRRVVLVLTLYSFAGAQPLAIDLNGQQVQTLPILAEQRVRRYLSTPLELPAGASLIELSAPQGGISPQALGQGDDPRPLSFNIHRAELWEVR